MPVFLAEIRLASLPSTAERSVWTRAGISMASEIIELFGYSAVDCSTVARAARASEECPFIRSPCSKKLNDGTTAGVCTIKPVRSSPVICCPIRLYADNYRILTDVATRAFGGGVVLCPSRGVRNYQPKPGEKKVAVFGKRWGSELPLPTGAGLSRYYVDWVLALLDAKDNLAAFVPVEVQSIDTTGNYRAERLARMNENPFSGQSSAGLNWENVNKRILPQLIYKGHVLRRERLCSTGLTFVCPKPVFDKIQLRLGGGLLQYMPQPGAITFIAYDLGPAVSGGNLRSLVQTETFTTTIDQVANAFSSPVNLPPANVYERAILQAL